MPRTRHLALAAVIAFAAAPLGAQGLRDQFAQLFVFGGDGVQLFLPGSANPNNPASVQAHGAHFIPASVGANGSLIAFIGNAIASSAANAPISAASSGTTFRFEGGVPVATSGSSGPVFAERAPTLGRGRMFVGVNRTRLKFSSLRGVPLDDIRLIFTHENVTEESSPGCSATNGGDCNQMGVPRLENDIMTFEIDLDIDVTVNAFSLTYGVHDRVDLSFEVPIVSASLRGRSDGQIIPFGGPPAVHFFGGTPDVPVLSGSQTIEGSATGLGDVGVRLKYNASRTDRSGLSFLFDARFPTGSEEDLLGSGHFAGRALAVLSSRFGPFTPHANVGYLVRNSDDQNDAVLTTVGFDQLLAPWATLAVDLISQFQVGANKLRLPSIVRYDTPFERSVQPTSIPDTRDDIYNASIGAKFRTIGDVIGVANAIMPLNRAGLRANLIVTLGLEYGF